ncbi:hypothetical protein BJ138DRAFT_1167396, partial [Hygrophoropsis aurantiaca]
ARILVDGLPLQHYGIELEGENRVTCWIPSEAGKRFSIFWQDLLQYRICYQTGDIRVDGVSCRSKILGPVGANCTVEERYFHTSPTTGRPFVFSNLQHTDDDAYLRSAPGELGEIVLSIWPVRIVGEAAHRRIQPRQNQIVHERAKKSYSHCVAFGNDVALPFTRSLMTERMSAAPFATFVFKYRPLERLIADGIAPPPPSPRPNKRPFSDMSGGSGDEAARRVQALTERVKQLEAELKDHKRARTEAADEIIDLTA